MRNEIVKELLLHGPLSKKEIQTKFDMPERSMTRSFKILIDDGIVEKFEEDPDPTRRSSYRVIPNNLPPEIVKDFREKLSVFFESIEELADTHRPERTRAVGIFVNSGMFSFDELNGFANFYRNNWSEFGFLRNKDYAPPSKFSLGSAHMIAKSGEIERTPVKEICDVKCDQVILESEPESTNLVPETAKLAVSFEGETAKMVPETAKLAASSNVLKKYNTESNICNILLKENFISVPEFCKHLKKELGGCLFEISPKDKRELLDDPEKFGKFFLDILLDEKLYVPVLSQEEKNLSMSLKKPGGLKQVKKKKPPKNKKSRPSVVKQKAIDESMAEQSMNPMYWGLPPIERDFDFAQMYVKAVFALWGESRGRAWNTKLGANGLSVFKSGVVVKKNKDLRNQINSARIQADLNGARYDDWIFARFDNWDDKANFNVPYPTPKYMGSDGALQAWEKYLATNKGGLIRFERSDLEKTDLPYLLPENFHANGWETRRLPNDDPCFNQKKHDEYEAQCKMYEDFMYPDMQRVQESSKGAYEVVDLMKQAVAKKIIPAEWVLGFGSHHKLPELKNIKL